MLNVTQIPALRVAFIDQNTGLISREWYRFLLNLFTLTGNGSSNVTITDLMVGPPPTTAEAQIAEIQKAIQALALNPLPPSAGEIINIVHNRLQDLEVGPSLSGLLSDIAVLQNYVQDAALSLGNSSLVSNIAVLQTHVQDVLVAPDNSSLVSEVALLKTAIQSLEQAPPIVPFVDTASGTVTSVDGSGGTTGLTLTGGPITNAGTLTIGGTLGTANGGTGTASPSLIAGSNISISGSWPNQTITASSSGGTVTSVTASAPLASSGGTTPDISFTGTLAAANGGTGASSLTGAGIVTLTDSQVITGQKNLTNYSSTYAGTTYATTNAYFGESSSYATIGGVNGVVFTSGSSFPGTGRFVADPNTFRPFADDVYALGTASFRYTVVYATTGTINTSDATQKQQVRELSEAERRVAKSIKGLIRAFKWNDAVESKGDGARIHIGVMAQEVQAAFAAEGLDASKYGLFCQDTWTTLDGSQTQFGVRYEELLAFVIAAL